MKIITDPRCLEYARRGHPESPKRIGRCLEKLRAQQFLRLAWGAPESVTETQLRRVHAADHLERLNQLQDFDDDTPALPEMAAHARRSAGAAMAAVRSTLAGEPAMSLMRPPGHHAMKNRAMGFCYLNNMALAVFEALDRKTGRIAVFDFDVHHGNGTEAILADQSRCALFSVHQFPAYPGTGASHIGNSRNYPMPPHAPREDYRDTLKRALDDLVKFKPDLVGVSAGFDAYRGDPLGSERLEIEDYYWLGSILLETRIPLFSLLEGGYSAELPELVLAYLSGLAGQPVKAGSTSHNPPDPAD
jgi:acetoin utilization deacetylase AcuC-like enzyme